MATFSATVVTRDDNYPDKVIIHDSEGILGSYRKPVALEMFEFTNLFLEMAKIIERLNVRECLQSKKFDTGDGSFGDLLSSIRFNSTYGKEQLHDNISLFFMHERIQSAYSERYRDLREKSEKKMERIREWAHGAKMLYIDLVLRGYTP